MKQTVSPTSATDFEQLEAQRSIVASYVSASSLEKYQTAAGKPGTLRSLLEVGVFKADQL